MYAVSKFDNIANNVSVPVGTTAGGVDLFAGLSPARPRQAVQITNCHTTATVYFKYGGATTPTAVVPGASGSFNFKLVPGADETIQCEAGVHLWAISDTDSTPIQIVELR